MKATRRRLLAVLAGGTVTTAGCAGVSDGQEDLLVMNETGATVTVDVSAKRLSDGEQLLSESVDLAPNGDGDESKESYGELVDSATVMVQVEVRDGPTDTYNFEDESDDTATLKAHVEADRVWFDRVTM